MAIMAMDMARKTSIRAFCLTLLCSAYSFAGDWQFEPSIKLGETYSDNVNLSTNNEASSWVSQAGILLDTSYKAQYAELNLSSESTYATYSHNHELDDDYHTLNGDFNIQLWPNGISLTGTADISNRSRNTSRNFLADIISSDTVRVETYNSGLMYNVNNSDFILNSSAGYQTISSDDNIGNSEGLVAAFNSRSGIGARNIFWDMRHTYQEIKNNGRNGTLIESEVKLGLITDYRVTPFIRYYDEDNSGNVNNGNNSIESSSYGLGVRWLISSRIYLDASYNKPIGNQLDINNKEQKEYINAAIKWQPSARTTLEASFSERFYGNSYGFDFTHRNKRLTNSINYVEDIQTLTRDSFIPVIIGQFWCPSVGAIGSISECILADGTTIIPSEYQLNTISEFELVEDDAFSLNKTLNWQSTLALSRTTLSFNANMQKRENLDTRIKDENRTASFTVKRELSSRSNVNLVLSYISNNLQIDTALERLDQYRRYQLAYEKSLNSMLLFNIEVSYLDRSSNDATLNYEEGRISAKITKGF